MITQELLRKYLELSKTQLEGKKRLDKLRFLILASFDKREELEAGPLTLDVKETLRQQITWAGIERVLGKDVAANLRRQLPGVSATQLKVSKRGDNA